MTILQRPSSSDSFRSWRVVAGTLKQHLCVQERTANGLEKNKCLGHRLMYRATDFHQYRVIYSCNPLDYESEETKEKAPRRKYVNKTPRMVLAVADCLSEIMEDWERVITVWQRRGHKSHVAMRKSPSVSIAPFDENRWNVLHRHVTTADKVSLKLNNETVREATKKSVTSYPNGIQNKTETVVERRLQQRLQCQDLYDKFFVRIIGLWYGYRRIEALVYIIALTVGWFSGFMHWPLFCLITLCVGFQWRSDEMSSGENERCMQTLYDLEKFLVWRDPQYVVATFTTLALIEYITTLYLHRGILGYTVEWVVPPLLILSLLYTEIYRLLDITTPDPDVVSLGTSLNQENIDSPSQPISNIPMKTVKKINVDMEKLLLLPLNAHEEAFRNEMAADGPFSITVRRTIEYASESNGWVKREKRSDGLVIWEKQSNYSNRTAILITANIPSANVGSLQHILLDDPKLEDKKTTYAYKYDTLLSMRALVKPLGMNELVVLSRFKSAGWGTAPRDVLCYISCANLFSQKQQEELGIRKFNSENTNGRELMAFAQCGIDCPEDIFPIPPSLVSRQHHRAAAHIYLVMGLEEADGSLTFRLCFDVDPKGNLPQSLQSYVNKHQIVKAERIAKLLSEVGPKPNMLRTYVNSREFFPFLESACNDVLMPEGVREMFNLETQPLPEPTTNVEVPRIAKRFIQELLLRDWQLHSTKRDVSLWTTTTPWTDKKAIKTVTFIPNVTLNNLDVVLNDLSLATKLDKSVKSKNVAKALSKEVKVIQTKFHSPMLGVAARDMVTRTVSYYPSAEECEAIGLISHTRVSQGPVFLHVSEDASEELPISSGFTRGRLFLYGVLAEETVDENGVEGIHLTRCAAADPGGSIPTVIINATLVLQIENTLKIVEETRERRAVSA